MSPSERTAAATALRRVSHLLVGRHVPDAVLAEIAAVAGSWADELDEAPVRQRPATSMVADLAVRPADGGPIEHFADCPISGRDNVLSLDLRARRDGDEAVIEVTLGAAHEGAPGRSHGGVVAGLFDDAFGFLVGITGLGTFAGQLTVRYVRPTPVLEPLVARCRLGERQGRRQWVHGELRHRDVVVAEASSILVVARPDQLGRATFAYPEPVPTEESNG